MEPKAGRLVKAIYDFPTDEPSELPLVTGDVIQVKERIDKQWSHGVCNDREGRFPLGFTVELKIPPLGDEEQLFAVANDFCAQESGDLSLKKGWFLFIYTKSLMYWSMMSCIAFVCPGFAVFLYYKI